MYFIVFNAPILLEVNKAIQEAIRQRMLDYFEYRLGLKSNDQVLTVTVSITDIETNFLSIDHLDASNPFLVSDAGKGFLSAVTTMAVVACERRSDKEKYEAKSLFSEGLMARWREDMGVDVDWEKGTYEYSI